LQAFDEHFILKKQETGSKTFIYVLNKTNLNECFLKEIAL